MSDPDLFRSVRRPDRRGMHLAGRLVRVLVVLAIVAVLAVAGWLLWRTSNALEPLELQTFVLNETDPDALSDSVVGTTTTLVVGVDRREAPPDDLADADGDPRGTAVTQSVMLLQTSPERPGTAVVTFPSNLAVDPPGVVGQTSLDRVQALGGPDLLLATIQDATGMPIDHYVEVDLAGMTDLVDAIGGVEVCLDDVVVGPEPAANGTAVDPSASPTGSPAPSAAPTPAASAPPPTGAASPGAGTGASTGASAGASAGTGAGADDAGGADASPAPSSRSTPTGAATGCQVLDGAAAAGFLSSRSDAALQVDEQRRRIAEQQFLVARVLDRATRTTMLANPFRVDAMLDALPTAIATDVDFSLPGLFRNAEGVVGHDLADLVVRVVPTQRLPDQQLQQWQPEQAEALFAALRGGDDLAGVGTTTTLEIGPQDVSVVVVNGVGVEGLAGQVAGFLTQRDFVVGGAVNPDELDPRDDYDPDQEVTVLRYVEGNEDLVEILTDKLGDLPLELQPVSQLPPMPRAVTVEEPTVLLEVGSGWNQ